MSQFIRTEMLIGSDNVQKLKNARVLVCGVGGVGGFCVEALARAGVGKIGLVDNDMVNESNINRQIVALHNTIGRKKIDVMRERIGEINPLAEVVCYDMFILNDNIDDIEIDKYDYIVDCVDTVTAKIAIIMKAKSLGKYIIASMGTGNKLDPSKFALVDIAKTSVCPLAAVMRRELRKREIKDVTVLYSTELVKMPIDINSNGNEDDNKRDEKENISINADGVNEPPKVTKRVTPASISYVPAVAGLLIAGEIIRVIIS